MNFRRLSPREGWRVFFGEVGVIVLGVLIALVAQEVANDWQWRGNVASTKAALDEEIRSDAVVGAERIATAPCLRDRLAVLAAKVAASDGRWKADPLVLPGAAQSPLQRASYAIPLVYRTPRRPITTDVWEQAKANGTLAHMSDEDVATYSVIYQQIGELREATLTEQADIPRLTFLGFDGTLDPATRVDALTAISVLDAIGAAIELDGQQLIYHTVKLGGRLSAAQEKLLQTNLAAQKTMRGECVDSAAALKAMAPLRGKA